MLSKTKVKRLIIPYILICVSMASLFASCVKPDDGDNPGPTGKTPGKEEYVYVPSYNTLTSEITDMQNPVISDGVVYFFQNVIVGQYEHEYNAGEGETTPMPAPMSRTAAAEAGVNVETEEEEIAEEGDAEVMPVDPEKPMPDEKGSWMQDIYEIQLFKINADGTGFEHIEGYKTPALPDNAPVGSSYYINQFKPVEGGMAWICEAGYFGYYDEEEGIYVENNQFHIRKISLATGEQVAELDLTKLREDNPYGYINNMAANTAGEVMVVGYDYSGDGNTALYIYAADGKFSTKISVPSEQGWIDRALALPDGRLAVVMNTNPDYKSAIRPVNIAESKLEDSIGGLPNNSYNEIRPLSGKLQYTHDEVGIFSFEYGKTERTYFLNWLDADVDNYSVNLLGTLDDNRILCVSREYDNTYDEYGRSSVKVSLLTLTKTPASEVKQKKVLTLACVYLDWTLRTEILKFNKEDPDYRIKVIDYSIYNTQDDYTLSTTKLNTEIIAGNVPDLLMTTNIPFGVYSAKGLIEDLYTYIDADTALGGRSAIVQPILKAMESNDGKLLQLTSGFYISTFIGKESIVGAQPGWTMDEVNAAKAKLASDAVVFAPYFTRENLLNRLFTYNMSEYVDWETGKCYFNTPEFEKLIEFAKTFPEEYNWDNYKDEIMELLNDRQMLQEYYLYSFDDMLRVDVQFRGEVAFKGFPCESRKGSSFGIMSGLAMTTRCSDKQGAWKFMRTLLTEEYQQNTWYFPTNQKVFDTKLKDAMTEVTQESYYGYAIEWEPTQEDLKNAYAKQLPDGTSIFPKGFVWFNTPDGMGEQVPYYAMNEAQREKFLTFLNSVDRIQSVDQKIVDIINDDLKIFFAGQKSAADTAKVIQDRVDTYVNEQR